MHSGAATRPSRHIPGVFLHPPVPAAINVASVMINVPGAWGALFVIVGGDLLVDVSTESGKRGENDSALEGNVANLERLE